MKCTGHCQSCPLMPLWLSTHGPISPQFLISPSFCYANLFPPSAFIELALSRFTQWDYWASVNVLFALYPLGSPMFLKITRFHSFFRINLYSIVQIYYIFIVSIVMFEHFIHIYDVFLSNPSLISFPLPPTTPTFLSQYDVGFLKTYWVWLILLVCK